MPRMKRYCFSTSKTVGAVRGLSLAEGRVQMASCCAVTAASSSSVATLLVAIMKSRSRLAATPHACAFSRKSTNVP